LAVMYIISWAFKSMSAANVAYMLNRHFHDMHRRNFQFLTHFIKKEKGLPCKDCKATILALTLFCHNLPTDRARELFKPSKEAKHLLGSFFKKSGTFMFKHFSV